MGLRVNVCIVCVWMMQTVVVVVVNNINSLSLQVIPMAKLHAHIINFIISCVPKTSEKN